MSDNESVGEKPKVYRVRANRGDSGSPQYRPFYFTGLSSLNEFVDKNDCLPHDEVEVEIEAGECYLEGVRIEVDLGVSYFVADQDLLAKHLA
jgi:hypothetical protein